MWRVFFLHALGSSGREWSDVIGALGDRFDCIALDIPGFGGTSDIDLDIAALVDWFANEVAARPAQPWAVVGHSMGGKIATVAAARAQHGEAALADLRAIVLLAASPPAPEPMDEGRRQKMLRWIADGSIGTAEAATFVDANCATRLPDRLRTQAMEDVMRSGPVAWRAWLEKGSREDWRTAVGQIAVPTLVVAGDADGDLGEDAQRRLNLPHYPDARSEVVAGAAHLLPYEAANETASLIARHVTSALAGASSSVPHRS